MTCRNNFLVALVVFSNKDRCFSFCVYQAKEKMLSLHPNVAHKSSVFEGKIGLM